MAIKLLNILVDCTANSLVMVDACVISQLLVLLGRWCGDAMIKVEVVALLYKLAGAIHQSATDALRAA